MNSELFFTLNDPFGSKNDPFKKSQGLGTSRTSGENIGVTSSFLTDGKDWGKD